jgi:hypothetical protein
MRKIINRMIAGERDPAKLCGLVHGRTKNFPEQRSKKIFIYSFQNLFAKLIVSRTDIFIDFQ